MFGVNVIAERAIADQGIMILGAETLDANFTQTTSQNFISPASLDRAGMRCLPRLPPVRLLVW